MSVSLGHTLTHPARAVLLQPRLDLVAQGAGPVGPSERLPADAIKVLREIFGPQIDGLKDRLVTWDGTLQPETKGQTPLGTTFYHAETRKWHAAVFPAALADVGKQFSDPRKFTVAVEAQEIGHVFLKNLVPSKASEVIAETVSLKADPNYFYMTLRDVQDQLCNNGYPAYDLIYRTALFALGSFSENYGYGFEGSTIEKGRQLMKEILASSGSRPADLTPTFMRRYASSLGFEPERFINDLRQTIHRTFEQATRHFIGEPGKLRLR